MNEKIIFHCDMDNFFASVELLDFPQYSKLPVAVAGDPKKRSGIILAKNTIAKKLGVKTAETIWSAKKKCPNLILLPPNHSKYKDFSKQILDIYYQYTDLIEPFSIDEAWLDVTGVIHFYKDPIDLANQIKSHIKNALGLSLSIGISSTKFFSKMCSSYNKPYGTTYVSKDTFVNLFGDKSISEMFFVGSATSKKLKAIGCKQIKDLFNYDEAFLNSYLGKQGSILYKYIHGTSSNKVKSIFDERDIKSIGHSMTFSDNLKTDAHVKSAILNLSQKVGKRLRKYTMHAYGVKIDIKDSNFNVYSKQVRLVEATNSSETISNIAFNLYKALWTEGLPIRLISVTAINLSKDSLGVQATIFDNQLTFDKNNEAIEKTLDSINKKYGKNTAFLASYLDKNQSITKLENEDFVINQNLDEISP